MTSVKTLRAVETPILIVDDNLQYTMVLKTILKGVFGYTDIVSVDNPDAGFELIQKEPKSRTLLFIDYNFPSGQTGGELLERLASAGLMEGKIAFLITSEPTVENQKQAIEAGAQGVVAKPFDRDALRAALERAERRLIADSTESF